MPDSLGTAVVVLGVVAALLVYALAWRATRGGTGRTKALVRGGLGLAIAAVVAVVLLTPNLQKVSEAPTQRWQERLDAESQEAPMEAMRKDGAPENAQPTGMPEMARERSLTEEDRFRTAPPPAASGEGAPAPGPIIVEPPVAAAPPAAAPPAATAPGAMPAPEPMSAPARRAATAANEQSEWDVVPVFYGTDRQEEPNPKRVAYNSDRGRRLDLGRALVTVPKSHQVPQIERPWVLRIPYFNVTIYEEAEDPKKHFTMQEIKKLPKAEFLSLVRERLSTSQRFKNHAIVFVHGYNTSFDHAVYRSAQIAYDLKFDGATFVYSWPSGGAVASYTYDRESAEAAVPYLRQFLEMVLKETGAKSISLIAHSMGNQPLLEVLKDMKSSAPEGVVISQVILAAPDVDADNFTNLAHRIEGFARGVTLYAASNDRALIISRNFWQNPRAGDVTASGPLIVPGIDTIDVTAASTDAFALNHSGYAENNELLQDIGTLIETGLRPPDLRLSTLKRVSTDRGDYWRYTTP